jgi:MFS family permease
VRRVWLRVVLAAGAGLVSLVFCSGVLVAIVMLFSHTTTFGFFGSGSGPRPIFWVGLVGLIIVAAASLSLPARALGAKRDHVTNTALLSVLGFCAFVFFVVVSLLNPYFGVPLALMAIVATPLVGSLYAIREDYRHTGGLNRATVIAAVAIYCASLLAALLAIWLVRGGEGWLYALLVPVIVASTSWLVLPAIVAALRPG